MKAELCNQVKRPSLGVGSVRSLLPKLILAAMMVSNMAMTAASEEGRSGMGEGVGIRLRLRPRRQSVPSGWPVRITWEVESDDEVFRTDMGGTLPGRAFSVRRVDGESVRLTQYGGKIKNEVRIRTRQMRELLPRQLFGRSTLINWFFDMTEPGRYEITMEKSVTMGGMLSGSHRSVVLRSTPVTVNIEAPRLKAKIPPLRTWPPDEEWYAFWNRHATAVYYLDREQGKAPERRETEVIRIYGHLISMSAGEDFSWNLFSRCKGTLLKFLVEVLARQSDGTGSGRDDMMARAAAEFLRVITGKSLGRDPRLWQKYVDTEFGGIAGVPVKRMLSALRSFVSEMPQPTGGVRDLIIWERKTLALHWAKEQMSKPVEERDESVVRKMQRSLRSDFGADFTLEHMPDYEKALLLELVGYLGMEYRKPRERRNEEKVRAVVRLVRILTQNDRKFDFEAWQSFLIGHEKSDDSRTAE